MEPSLLEVAEAAALAAGKLAVERWRAPRTLMEKGNQDLVTDVDFAAQKIITDHIAAAFPDHGFLTEEHDATLAAAGRVIWVIDPIDGTTNYSRQVPLYNVSIAATVDGQALVGVVYDAVHEELFVAERGAGARCNGQPIRVNDVARLERAVLSCDWSRGVRQRGLVLETIGRIAPSVHTIRSFGSAALAICWIAAGRVDCYFNYTLSAWDIAAAGLIVHEAGGRMTGADGAPYDLRRPTTWTLASNGALHDALLAHIAVPDR